MNCPRSLLRTASIGIAIGALTVSSNALARGPFVTIRDDGTLSGTLGDPEKVTRHIVDQFKQSGAPIPEFLSVWTAFPMDKNNVETVFWRLGNDVTGIGLQHEWGGDGKRKSPEPPLRSVLFHNNFTKLALRAATQNVPVEGFAQYTFLLEFSHTWGPSIRVNADPDAGVFPDQLLGSPFHWSFWLNAGGSPAGGNKWKDNGDGTFSVEKQTITSMTYSMLDLYLMGLAEPSEVAPFSLLEGAIPPSGVSDPFTKKAYSAASFPWISDKPFTVTGAHLRTITIEDVIATNGPRQPAASNNLASWSLGIALVVLKDASDKDVSNLEESFTPIAESLAPTIVRATRERVQVTVVTAEEPADAGAANEPTDASSGSNSPNAPAATPTNASGDSGCAFSRGKAQSPAWFAGLAAIALLVLRRTRGVAK